ncbi:MAG TPA: hypothetical protein VFX51_23065 [Solirubrobacteraceae bacterium]|nr:hypothetical protein [Solirubrobacteraceae bacterium]
MTRFTMVLAAAVATAMLVIATSALDAVGADPPAKASAEDTLIGKLADCLRGRGVAVPALDGAALDRWLQTHRLPDADGRACKTALAPRGTEVREAPSESVKELSACLRAQGLDVPTDPVALKDWLGHQRGRTTLDAMKTCGLVMKPDPGLERKPAPCGVEPAKGSDGAKAPPPSSSPRN